MSFLETLFNFLAKGRYYSTPQAYADGAVTELQTDSRGYLLVNGFGGNSTWQDTLAPAAERQVKSAAGQLFQLVMTNTDATDVWVFVFNTLSRPANGGVPVFVPIKVAAGKSRAITLQRPRDFNTGIYWGCSSTGTTFTYKSGGLVQAAAEYS